MGQVKTLKTIKFINHSPSLLPVNNLASHYTGFIEKRIKDQTGDANWFIAELKDSADGGTKNNLYLIYNPTDKEGNPLTSSSNLKAKLCYAPNPPFNSDDTPDNLDLFELLIQIKDELISLKDKNK